MKVCQSCKKENLNEAKFCRYCGTSLETTMSCPSCGSQISVSDIYCEKCGYKLKEDNNVKKKSNIAKFAVIIGIVVVGLILVIIKLNNNSTVQNIDENLKQYGTEYAESLSPAYDIAWELVRIAEEEFLMYDVYLNPSEVELEPTKISEFQEELELSSICCQPYADFMNGSGTLWIRTGWSPKTNELKNIFAEFNDDYVDVDALMYSIFHYSEIEGLGEVYDKLAEAEIIEIDGYNMRIVDNIVALYFQDGWNNGYYNIEFLPHSVHVEDGKLYYSTGEKVDIDFSWGHNVIN